MLRRLPAPMADPWLPPTNRWLHDKIGIGARSGAAIIPGHCGTSLALYSQFPWPRLVRVAGLGGIGMNPLATSNGDTC